jgi:predicted nucleic acid-binding Zn ribbon protein
MPASRGKGWSAAYRASTSSGPRVAPTKLGDFLGQFLEHQGVKEQIERVSVLEEWAERVGPKIAEVTRARSVAERTLFVEVRSSAWLMELNMMKGRILARINEGRPDSALEKLVFVLSQDG